MCSKRFLNSPPLYSKNVWVLILSCPSQRLQGSGPPLCSNVSFHGGWLWTPTPLSLSPSESCQEALFLDTNVKPFFFLGFYSLFSLLELCRHGGASCLEKAYLFSLASVYYCEDGLERQLRGPIK